MNPILGFLLDCLSWCLRWLAFMFVVVVLATPVILILAVFRAPPIACVPARCTRACWISGIAGGGT
jgi:hypothetical protein